MNGKIINYSAFSIKKGEYPMNRILLVITVLFLYPIVAADPIIYVDDFPSEIQFTVGSHDMACGTDVFVESLTINRIYWT